MNFLLNQRKLRKWGRNKYWPRFLFVYIKAHDAYISNLPLIEAMKSDDLLVHQWEGVSFWKNAKWIGEIEFRDYDELGWWEKRGYSNTAEPWLNDWYF